MNTQVNYTDPTLKIRDKNFYYKAHLLSIFQLYYGVDTPSRHDTNKSKVAELGRWAHRIRRAARKGELQKSRIDYLKSLNFEFNRESGVAGGMPDSIERFWTGMIDEILTTNSYSPENESLFNVLVDAQKESLLINSHAEKLGSINLKQVVKK